MKMLNVPKKIENSIINSERTLTSQYLVDKFNLEKRTASIYLSRLSRDGLITRIGRGIYLSSKEINFNIEIDPNAEKIHNIIKNNLPYLDFVIWSIFNLKKLFHLIPTKNYIFIEAEDIFELKTIKDLLFDQGIESIINPDIKDFENLPYRKEVPVLLFKRKNSYGIKIISGINTPIFERCIIDLYYYITRKHLNFPFEEIRTILVNIIKAGKFNFSFALRYAKIRNIELEFLLIFSKLHQILPNDIPIIFTKRIKKIQEVLELIFGENWIIGIL